MSIPCIPSLYVKSKQEDSTKVALRLTKAKSPFVIRLTGGCGYMSDKDAEDLYDLFAESLEGFNGAILFGGTRMVKKNNHQEIVPGITEIVPIIRKNSLQIVTLGVVPKTNDLQISMELGMIVSNEPDSDYITIIHPDQDTCLVIQLSCDCEVPWDAEYEECLRIISSLRDYAGWNSLLIAYNGGGTTEKEILATAKKNWPVLLIKESGRVSGKLANDKDFLKQYPSVYVADKDADSIRAALYKIRVPLNEVKPSYTIIKGGRVHG